MEWSAKWIVPAQEMGDVCPVFVKEFAGKEGVAKAELFITAMGVYEASLNGERVDPMEYLPDWS